jgi:hypothetical protein
MNRFNIIEATVRFDLNMPMYHPGAGFPPGKNANAAFIEAQNASDISTSYVMTTLLYSIVLFLCGVGEKWDDVQFKKLILETAILFFSIPVAFLLWLLKKNLKSAMTCYQTSREHHPGEKGERLTGSPYPGD